MDSYSELYEKLKQELKRLKESKVFSRPNVSPPSEWEEIESIFSHMRTFRYKNELRVQVSCETYGEETWLRITCARQDGKTNDKTINLVLKDFLGEQWIEPNRRTFVFKPEDRKLAANPAVTHILFCLTGQPDENGFVLKQIIGGFV